MAEQPNQFSNPPCIPGKRDRTRQFLHEGPSGAFIVATFPASRTELPHGRDALNWKILNHVGYASCVGSWKSLHSRDTTAFPRHPLIPSGPHETRRLARSSPARRPISLSSSSSRYAEPVDDAKSARKVTQTPARWPPTKSGFKGPQQLDDLDVTVTLRLQPPARSDPVQIAVDVELQKVARRVAGTPHRLRLHPQKPRRRKIQPFDEGVDEPHRVVPADIVVHRLRQQQKLVAFQSGDVSHARF